VGATGYPILDHEWCPEHAMIEIAPGWTAAPDAPALITADGTLSYADLRDLADGFGERIGRDRRKLVFLEARNTPASIAAYVACLGDRHPVYLFNPDSDLTQLQARYQPDAVIRFDGETTDIQRLAAPEVAFHPELSVLLSTSGSTGSPKFVRLSWENLSANARSIAEYLELTPADRAITSLKFAYSYGMSVINSHLAVGASLVLSDASVIEPAFWDSVRQHRVTSFAGVPHIFETLQSSTHLDEVTSLRYVTQAGGRLAPDLVRHFARRGRERGWKLFVMYGQTEAAPRIAYLPPDQAEAHPDAIGVAIPRGELWLEAAGARVTVPDVEGELVYRGPNVMMGYALSREDLALGKDTAELRTGDLAVRNAAGLFVITGRRSRFVKPFGLRINLDEVEAAVRAVAPAALVTGDDDGLVIALPDAASGDRVRQLVSDRVKLPTTSVRIEVWEESPKLPNGKTDYKAILARARGMGSAPTESLAKTVLSGRYFSMLIEEVKRMLGFGVLPWASVAEIYGRILGKPAQSSDTFVDLAGDSLSFVQVSIALEEYLGRLPADWERLPISELEGLRTSDLVL
jgi:acyl-CoA synthetase (AMP-forming)/AMP-acid ligase II